ncbi:MAG: hypothetical protein NZ891_07970, partial [bacterium]|nr:hypothetical protein [bacterium]MDW8164657.1 hypothetical protein [Candidatus Omnitrophota bacterium]
MKKILIFLTFFPFLIFSNNEETNITLKQQMVLDLCGFPNLKEGIIDILYLTIENYWHIGDYSKIFPLFKLITQISP